MLEFPISLSDNLYTVYHPQQHVFEPEVVWVTYSLSFEMIIIQLYSTHILHNYTLQIVFYFHIYLTDVMRANGKEWVPICPSHQLNLFLQLSLSFFPF